MEMEGERLKMESLNQVKLTRQPPIVASILFGMLMISGPVLAAVTPEDTWKF